MTTIRPNLTLTTHGLHGGSGVRNVTVSAPTAGPSGPALQGDMATIVHGLDAVRAHAEEHGIVLDHLPTLMNLANGKDGKGHPLPTGKCVFGLRATNPHATDLIAEGSMTKDLTIKGKTADTGPMAGRIPRLQRFSKSRGDTAKVKKSDDEVISCEKKGDAAYEHLVVSEERLKKLQRKGLFGIRGKLGAGPVEFHCEINGDRFLLKGRPKFEGLKVSYEIFHEDGKKFDILAKPDPDGGPARPLTADYDLLLHATPMEEYGVRDNYRDSRHRSVSPTGNALRAQLMGSPQEMNTPQGAERRNRFASAGNRSEQRSSSSVSTQNRGMTSARLNEFSDVVNRQLDRDPIKNPVIHHGPESHNPEPTKDIKDILPSVFFVPPGVAGIDGVALIRTPKEMRGFLQAVKDAGYQYFTPKGWPPELAPENFRRSTYNAARPAVEELLRSRSVSRRGSLEPSRRGSTHDENTSAGAAWSGSAAGEPLFNNPFPFGRTSSMSSDHLAVPLSEDALQAHQQAEIGPMVPPTFISWLSKRRRSRDVPGMARRESYPSMSPVRRTNSEQMADDSESASEMSVGFHRTGSPAPMDAAESAGAGEERMGRSREPQSLTGASPTDDRMSSSMTFHPLPPTAEEE
jgi:hypothetical protein